MKKTHAHDCGPCQSRREFFGCVSASLTGAFVLPVIADALDLLPVVEAAGAQAGAEHAYAIPAQDSVNIDKKAQIILVRYQQKVIAFNLACPHENTALKWRDGDKRFQCPKHDSKYTPEGVFKDGRATRNMDRLAIRRQGDQVFVSTDRLYMSDKQPKEWAEAVVPL
jgi:nitrite reductase/ring-hydroxylating ferredoxin subunit